MVTEIFNKRNPNYQLRHTSHFSIPPVRSVYNGTENLSFLGPKIWDIVPTELKEVKTLSAFKSGIKKWWPQTCPCRPCKQYLPNIFFYITLAHFIPGGNKRLRMLNQSVSMCDLLLPTCFKGPNVIASQRCDSVLGFMVKVLRN